MEDKLNDINETREEEKKKRRKKNEKHTRLKLLFHWRHQSRTNSGRYIDLHVL